MAALHSSSPVIFGEVLFDCFPGGDNRLGGAPFNVAWHLQAFGIAPTFISRIGQDHLGEQITQAMQDWRMDCRGLQIDPHLPTGRVDVVFSIDGEPSYTICHPVAYDHMSTEDLPDFPHPSLIYHGSLALRSPETHTAFQALRDRYDAPIFLDVNLRAPWWQKDDVLDLISSADWVKLNQDELNALNTDTGDITQKCRYWIEQYNLKGVILTMGASGAHIITQTECLVSSPPRVQNPVDPVGAGDAFSAVFILGLLQDWDLTQTLVKAQDFAAKIVEQRGAVCTNSQFYADVMCSWGEMQTTIHSL